jgi:hypothetical protein
MFILNLPRSDSNQMNKLQLSLGVIIANYLIMTKERETRQPQILRNNSHKGIKSK